MKYLILLLLPLAVSCGNRGTGSAGVQAENATAAERTGDPQAERALIGLSGDTVSELSLSDAEWKEKLTPEQYYILREDGTERPFSSELLEEKGDGVFVCAACQLPLFNSETKFESGTGWPSFYEPAYASNVLVGSDNTMGMSRDEVSCARCGGHQGHVFNDGPKPTGLRYCIDGDGLEFVAKP